MEGGTTTLTNLGAYHVDAFTPIINPPQSAILGVGSIAPRPAVGEDGALTVRPTVHLSLTFDTASRTVWPPQPSWKAWYRSGSKRSFGARTGLPTVPPLRQGDELFPPLSGWGRVRVGAERR